MLSSTALSGLVAEPRPRRLARSAAASMATAGLALLVAACSSGSPPNTARAGSYSSGSVSPALAFARCLRSEGDPSWPDPDSSGQEPPSAKQGAASNPRFPAAVRACVHLLPNGGQETRAQIVADQRSAARFAECMRSHGLPNWPDATNDSEGRPFFNAQAAGLDTNSPQVSAAEQTCHSLLHIAQLPRGA
jgi:hypothetical protein